MDNGRLFNSTIRQEPKPKEAGRKRYRYPDMTAICILCRKLIYSRQSKDRSSQYAWPCYRTTQKSYMPERELHLSRQGIAPFQISALARIHTADRPRISMPVTFTNYFKSYYSENNKYQEHPRRRNICDLCNYLIPVSGNNRN